MHCSVQQDSAASSIATFQNTTPLLKIQQATTLYDNRLKLGTPDTQYNGRRLLSYEVISRGATTLCVKQAIARCQGCVVHVHQNKAERCRHHTRHWPSHEDNRTQCSHSLGELIFYKVTLSLLVWRRIRLQNVFLLNSFKFGPFICQYTFWHESEKSASMLLFLFFLPSQIGMRVDWLPVSGPLLFIRITDCYL